MVLWQIIVAAVVGMVLGGAVAIQVWRVVVGRRIRATCVRKGWVGQTKSQKKVFFSEREVFVF